MSKLSLLSAALGAALLSTTPVSIQWSAAKPSFVSVNTAEARIGRPGTPMSVAGVNRRMHRRAYYGAAAGAYYNSARCGHYPYHSCY